VKLAIHQPEFMPWPGYFQKMFLADQFVIFDHVQFKKRYFENRNQIVSPKGESSFLTVPIISKSKFEQAINVVDIDTNQKQWKRKILNKIEHYYSRSKYFNQYFPEIEALFVSCQSKKLIDLNLKVIDFFRNNLGISTPVIYSSELPLENYKASELILEICKLQSADIYLCGVSGRDYLKIDDFNKNNISIQWLDYQPPQYQQLSKNYVPYMSTLDILLNYGDKSMQIILHQNV